MNQWLYWFDDASGDRNGLDGVEQPGETKRLLAEFPGLNKSYIFKNLNFSDHYLMRKVNKDESNSNKSKCNWAIAQKEHCEHCEKIHTNATDFPCVSLGTVSTTHEYMEHLAIVLDTDKTNQDPKQKHLVPIFPASW